MELPRDVSVVLGRTLKPSGTLLRRVTDKLVGYLVDEHYLWAKVNRIPLQDGHFDLIYSRSQPGSSHILAYRVKQETGKPWIAQFSDPWANNPYHSHHSGFRKSFNRKWEQRVVETADKLVFPTREIQAMYVDSYPHLPILEKSLILPHHFTSDLYPKQSEEPVRGPADKVTFSYLGSFYGSRSPEPFLKALQYVLDKFPEWKDRIQINLYGNVSSGFAAMVDACPVPIARGRAPYLETLKMMRQSDVLLLIDAPSATGSNPFLASKLIDYLGAGRRILGITDEQGTAADILRESGHTVVSPRDVDGIATAIERYMEICLREGRTEVPIPNQFETRQVVGKLASVMQEMMRD